MTSKIDIIEINRTMSPNSCISNEHGTFTNNDNNLGHIECLKILQKVEILKS
jgi:hypothetical protein